ncbi:MAG: hypothetical protein IJ916_11230 [Paludibacteraceae bacterium]|nr:hypothetical protein [Paludibacteraceae bacterium]
MENSKSVLVIGNGFDVALGRPTKYSNFYESEFCPKRFPAPLIGYLNGCVNQGDAQFLRWMDIESAIQKYAQSRGKGEVHDGDSYTEDEKKLIEKIYGFNLAPIPHRQYDFSAGEEDLLKQMQNVGKIGYERTNTMPYWNFDFADLPYDEFVNSSPQERDIKALSAIESGLANYLNSIDCNAPKDKQNLAYQLLLRFWRESSNGEIYSFNYTSLEPLIRTFDTYSVDLSLRINYMHGSLSEDHVILGAGKEINERGYGEWAFLKKSNDNDYRPPMLVEAMKNASKVIVYGFSFSEIDIQYFNYLFNYMLEGGKSKIVKIFDYGKKGIRSIKNNIKNIDDLQTLGVNVIDVEGKDASVFDCCLEDPVKTEEKINKLRNMIIR